MDYEIILADFQQFYHMDVRPLIQHEFSRYAALLWNLPFESRFIQKYCQTKDWDWGKETQSRILHTLETISCQFANMMKKQGQAAARPSEQFQPDYVKEAKRQAEQKESASRKLTQEDMGDIKQFWQNHNSKVKSNGD